MLEIANIRAMMLMKQYDDDTDREVSDENSKDPGESTVSSDIGERDLYNQQNVLYLDQAGHDERLQTTNVPPPKKRNRANTFIAHISLPNLRHPAGTIAPPWLKCQQSTINILRKSDFVAAQALLFPKSGGDQSVPQ